MDTPEIITLLEGTLVCHDTQEKELFELVNFGFNQDGNRSFNDINSNFCPNWNMKNGYRRRIFYRLTKDVKLFVATDRLIVWFDERTEEHLVKKYNVDGIVHYGDYRFYNPIDVLKIENVLDLSTGNEYTKMLKLVELYVNLESESFQDFILKLRDADTEFKKEFPWWWKSRKRPSLTNINFYQSPEIIFKNHME